MQKKTLIKVDNISKKFCRDLHKSLFYGLHDIWRELSGGNCGKLLREHEFWSLKDISFELNRGECLGLIGENGAGKSTLLKIINGILKPDNGVVELYGRVGILIALGVGFNPVLTGRENIYINAAVLGMSKKEIENKLDEIIDFCELGELIDSPVQNYSSGMQVRLGFAIATQIDCEILLIDEILAVGDSSFKDKCFRKMAELKEKGTSFIFVSHNPYHILQACDKALYLSQGKVKNIGNVSEVLNEYESDQTRMVEDVSKRKNAFIQYPGNIIIKEYGFIQNNDLIKDAVNTGKPAKFVVYCESRIESNDINLTVVIRDLNNLGSLSLVLSSFIDGKKLELTHGMNKLEIIFPLLGLRPSSYISEIKIRRGSLGVEDAINNYHFNITSSTAFGDSIYNQPHEWNCGPVD